MNDAQQSALDRVRERKHGAEDLDQIVWLVDALLLRQEADAVRIVSLEDAERYTLAKCHDAWRKYGPSNFQKWLSAECLRTDALTTPKEKECSPTESPSS